MTKNKPGFTLIELIIYVALVAIFTSGTIIFAWDIIYGGAKSGVQREISQNLRLISKRLEYEIRNSSAINTVSASDLCLASTIPARNPTRFYVVSGAFHLAWGGNTSDCTNMTNDLPLTSNQVEISGLTFVNRSNGSTTLNIDYAFTLSSNGVRQEWQNSQSYFGSTELRSN